MQLIISQCIRQPHSRELFGQNVNSTKKVCKPLLTRSISHSPFSIYCANHFLHFSCIFIFLKIIKHNTLKMLHYLLPSSILKWPHKSSPILISFFKCTLIGQLSQYNLTKLFLMKFKTSKRYETPVQKELNEHSGQLNTSRALC